MPQFHWLSFVWLGGAFFASLAICVRAGAQGVAERPTPLRTLQTWSRTFTQISAVRELSDGSVLVLDARDRSLFSLPQTSAPGTQVGRTGSGPGEYRYPVFLAALSGDTSLLVDGQRREWLLLDRARFVDMSEQLRSRAQRIGVELKGIDKHTSALSVVAKRVARTRTPVNNDPSLNDSLYAIVHTASGRVDTVATLFSEASGRSFVRVPGEREPFSLPSLLNASDQAVMFSDGSVAVVRVSPYRVDRRLADGRLIRGPAVNESPISVTRETKQVLVRNFKSKPDGAAFFRIEDFPQWPQSLPAFRSGAAMAGADGNVYVRRTAISRDSMQHVDVFDLRGVRIRRFSLPARSRLVGSGARGLYVARVNENDEELLVRISY